MGQGAVTKGSFQRHIRSTCDSLELARPFSRTSSGALMARWALSLASSLWVCTVLQAATSEPSILTKHAIHRVSRQRCCDLLQVLTPIGQNFGQQAVACSPWQLWIFPLSSWLGADRLAGQPSHVSQLAAAQGHSPESILSSMFKPSAAFDSLRSTSRRV